ncbi:MAG: aminopeptidase [Pseudomonadota bacterium]
MARLETMVFKRKAVRVLSTPVLLVCAALALCGCRTLEFYGQAVTGQLDILERRRPIAELLASTAVSPGMKERFELVLRLRVFARDALFLPVGQNYLTYVELDRPYAAWNVFAAPEFSLEPYLWWYPLVGRLSYRGYFSQAAATDHADMLRKQGYDVYVGGVPAYSTLGWFDDPVFSSFIRWPEADLADLIFHESAHRLLFVAGDTAFNEGFAVTVGLEGARRWLAAAGRPEDFEKFQQRQVFHRAFVDLVLEYRQRLGLLYAERSPAEEKRIAKQRIIGELKAKYLEIKAGWGGYRGYDAWFERPLNNAQLLSVGSYNDLVPAFQALLAAQNGSLPLFHDECRALAKLPPKERQARLRELIVKNGQGAK